MTTEIRSFSTSAAGNNSSGAFFPEGQAPSTVNDSGRALQAAIRRQWNDAQWFAIGDRNGPATFTVLTATSFRVEGATLATIYHTGRRVRATGTVTGTIYGTITAGSAVSGNTDVTVDWDSGSLASENVLIELGIISAVNSAFPAKINHDVDFAGNMDIGGNLAVGGGLTSLKGPFLLSSIVRRDAGGSALSIPSSTKLLVVKAFGSGGGGSASGGAFGVQGNSGANGSSFTISGSGFQMVVSGGRGATSKSGQSTSAPDPITVTGAAAFWTKQGMGSPGGVGAIYGTSGNHGAYAEAHILNPSFGSLSYSGGGGGNGGNNSVGQGGGADGQDAFAVHYFYE